MIVTINVEQSIVDELFPNSDTQQEDLESLLLPLVRKRIAIKIAQMASDDIINEVEQKVATQE